MLRIIIIIIITIIIIKIIIIIIIAVVIVVIITESLRLSVSWWYFWVNSLGWSEFKLIYQKFK